MNYTNDWAGGFEINGTWKFIKIRLEDKKVMMDIPQEGMYREIMPSYSQKQECSLKYLD